MIKVKKTLEESCIGDYVSPSTQIVQLHSEGILCTSFEGASNEDFTEGGEYIID